MLSLLALIALTATSATYFQQVEALESTVKCKGQEIKITDDKIQTLKDCAAAIGVTDKKDLTKDKIGCFSKCILEKQKLVDADGKPHKENIQAFIDSSLPDNLKAAAKKGTEACLDKHGGSVNPKEASCMSYVPLAICSQKVMIDICV